LRKRIYFFILHAIRGLRSGYFYDLYWQEDQKGIPPDTTEKLLVRLLEHCQKNVPYYAGIMKEMGDFHKDPVAYLQHFPILTKEIIRSNFENLKSADLEKRKWFLMTSGGSTGEPGKVIQDYEFTARNGAIQLFFSRLAGRETGELEVYLWGSDREITHGRENWKARIANLLTNSVFFNAFRMSPDQMRTFVAFINRKKPKLIVAYANSITSLAKFIEKEGLHVEPQKAIITSAETLHPFMREKIERVFQCRVYNRYGSREIGNIACERPGCQGLWVAPWGNYLEIIDSQGKRLPDGSHGEILVTSLTNYAMPLIRYRIGDCGILLPQGGGQPGAKVQVLQAITGRTGDLLNTENGDIIDSGFLEGLFYYKEWVKRFQIIQNDFKHIVYQIVLTDGSCPQSELDEVAAKTRLLFGKDCRVDFDFVDDIAESDSGKFRWVINRMEERTPQALL